MLSTDPELMKARKISESFMSDMPLSEVKAMLRGRGEAPTSLIPKPVLRLPPLQTEGYGCASDGVSDEGLLLYCDKYYTFFWYWLSYQLRTHIYICELLCDLLQQHLPNSVRIISESEQAMIVAYLVNRFAVDMFELKREAVQSDNKNNSVDGQEENETADLLVRLMKKYEGGNKSKNKGFSGANLSVSSWLLN